MRRLFVLVLVVAALVGVGLLGKRGFERARAAIIALDLVEPGDGWPIDSPESWLKGPAYPEDWFLFPGFDESAFPPDAEAFRAFAATAPARPLRADLWGWWRAAYPYGLLPESPPPAPPATAGRDSADSEAVSAAKAKVAEYRRKEERWNAAMDFLRTRDPDNGWPLALMALLEIRAGTLEEEITEPDPGDPSQTRTRKRWPVTDPSRSAEAARLLHAAVRMPRFDMAMDELTLADFARLGGRAKDLPELARYFHAQSNYGLTYFMLPADLARRMTGEAERRAENGAADGDGLDAVDVLRDIQTLAAHIMAREIALVHQMIANTMTTVASMEGDRILRAAGREDEARALVDRGRRLAWPFVIKNAMQKILWPDAKPSNNAPTLATFMIYDPAVMAEAKRLLALPARADAADWRDKKEAGFFENGGIVSLDRIMYAPEAEPTRAGLRASTHFEYLGLIRIFSFFSLVVSAGLLALFSLLYFVQWIAGFIRPMPKAPKAADWPGPEWIAPASLVFAALSFGALFLTAWIPGSLPARMLGYAHGGDNGKITAVACIFWIVWGVLAGWSALVGLAERARRRAPDADDRDAAAFLCTGWRSRLVDYSRRWIWIPLAASAILVFGVELAMHRSWGSAWANPLLAAAFVLLLPAAGTVLLQGLGVLFGMPTRALGRTGGRQLLAGLAGCVLLGLGVYGLLGIATARAAARDTLLIPDAKHGYVPFTEREGRYVEHQRRHARRFLRDEGFVPVSVDENEIASDVEP